MLLGIVFLIAITAIIGLLYLWKTRRLRCLSELLLRDESSGLEFLKLPEEIEVRDEVKENKVKGVELIHFKGKNGLELLVPPSLKELEKEKGKNLRVKPITTLLTGKNLTGYFLLLTKLLFLLRDVSIFLVVKERELERFKHQSNIAISIFKQKNALVEKIKLLTYQFHKGIISEEEFKKKLLKLKLQSVKSMLNEPLYDGYKYFSRPSQILKDVQNFLSKTKKQGIVVITILDEMMEKNPRKARVFLEDLVSLCTKHSTPLLLTSEQGAFEERVHNVMKSYCDIVLETELKEGRRYVTVYSFEKVFSQRRVSKAIKNYEKFLKRVNLVEEK